MKNTVIIRTINRPFYSNRAIELETTFYTSSCVISFWYNFIKLFIASIRFNSNLELLSEQCDETKQKNSLFVNV